MSVQFNIQILDPLVAVQLQAAYCSQLNMFASRAVLEQCNRRLVAYFLHRYFIDMALACLTALPGRERRVIFHHPFKGFELDPILVILVDGLAVDLYLA